MFKPELYNIFILSFAYCIYFLSFNTSMNCLKYLLESMKLDDVNFTASAYTGLALHFFAYIMGPFYGSVLVNKIGPRTTMVAVAITQLFYCIQFFFAIDWMFYTSILIRGASTGCLVVAQGRFLTQNSTKETIGRNSAIFSWIFSLSRIVGNWYLYFKFDSTSIKEKHRYEMFSLMIGSNIVSCILFAVLLKAKWNMSDKASIKDSYLSLFKLFCVKDIWLLVPSITYNMVLMAFNTGIYANAVGFTERLQEETPFKKITACGTVLGFGCLFGGVSLSISSIFNKQYHFPAIVIGFILNAVAFIIAFINLPHDAHQGPTLRSAYIESNYALALVCPFLLGTGEMYLFSEINAIVGLLYKDDIAHAFAFISFVYGMVGIPSFFLFDTLSFRINVGILMFCGLLSTACFCYAELKPSARRLIKTEPKEDDAVTTKTKE